MVNICSRIGRHLRAFQTARGGNIAITFALALIPIIGAAGAAIDYSRANAVKADLQGALDAAALMLSKEAAADTDSQLQTNALKYFKANFVQPLATNITVSATYSSANSSVLVNGSAKIPTDIMQILGYNTITIVGSSTAKWGIDQLRVALVLDNTGSMADAGKIAALKTATKSMLSMLQSASVTNGDIQVAIIPFANGVDVGVGNVSQPWIDWSYYSNSGGAGWGGGGGNGGGSSGRSSWSGSSWGSNSWSSGNGAWNSKGTWNGSGSSSCTWSSCWTSGGTWSASTSTTNTSHWQGCVMDRDQNYDVQNTNPTTSNKSTLFPAIYNTACPVPMMGLSYDWTDLNATVDSMTPTGTTNQTIGLDWGWMALTQGEPFDNPAMPANSKLAIVMLTDGLNTENRWSTDQATIDARTLAVCTNIKTAGITLYTIQVNTGNDPTSTMLQNCATDKTKNYVLTSADQIVTTFNDIAAQLAKLRIAK